MKTGILLSNLGSPQAPTPAAVRAYLKEFLWDKRVVDTWRPLWWLVLHGIILRVRPKKTAGLYQKIWTKEGAPLLAISQKQKCELQNQFKILRPDVCFALGMRYGSPSLEDALTQLLREGCERILLFPLYPQFSHTTTGSTQAALRKILKNQSITVPVQSIESYATHPKWIAALVNSILQTWQTQGQPEKLIFSYHGLPQRYVRRGDPYFAQCVQSTRLVVQSLGLKKSAWKMTFQSRFGREPWLKPYTDEVLQAYAKQKVDSVQVICPGFAADCLETLEEINGQSRQAFANAHGKKFSYIPALNTTPSHIEALAQILQERLASF